jgi:O-antigen/teichoic acid export membrane protein
MDNSEHHSSRTRGMNIMSLAARVKDLASRTFLGENLRAKAARGGFWLGGGSAAEQVTRFARNMLLTRLLAPGAFGAMAIVMSTSSIITSLSDVGIWPAVIHSPRGGDDSFLNAAWWLGLARALAIYAVLFPVAPWIAHFYGNYELTALLRVTLLGVVLDSLISPRAKLAQKEMRFGRFALLSNGGAICGIITTVILSFILRNVWALAIGYCAENAFRCIFSYFLCPGFPSLRWDKHSGSELITFSKGMIGLSFLNLIFSRTDIFVLGKLYSPAMLGFYTMGVALLQTPSFFLINVMSQTLMPAYSQVQSDARRVNKILIEVSSWSVLLGLPVLVLIALCGSSLLTIVYGSRYAAATGAMIVAGCVAALNVLNNLITSLFFALGRPALHRRAVAASAVVMLALIYPCVKYFGIVGGQVAALAAIVASFLLQVVRLRDITSLAVIEYGRAFLPGLLVAGGMIFAYFAARSSGITTRPSLDILISIGAGLIGYAFYGLTMNWSRQAR